MTELNWQKSTYSEEASSCVEIAVTPAAIRIRDSKHTDGPISPSLSPLGRASSRTQPHSAPASPATDTPASATSSV
ncbi:DUF397 domain-containing protein [Streptomyces sp. B21-083]|uniref:DUF397 domain-containing protein n=1 Tax=Streptomyces sp. B21-083 TaxID=3039410 RepID=UPI002FF10208